MNYTLVAYKPSGADICRGCLMETYDADFELVCTDDRDELIKRWAELRMREKQADGPAFQFHLLFDGVDTEFADFGSNDYLAVKDIERAVTDQFDKQWAAYCARRDESAKRSKAAEKRASENEERRQLAELKAKYEGTCPFCGSLKVDGVCSGQCEPTKLHKPRGTKQ